MFPERSAPENRRVCGGRDVVTFDAESLAVQRFCALVEDATQRGEEFCITAFFCEGNS